MLLEKIISSGAIYMPFPIQINGSNWKGSRFDFSPICNAECFTGKGKYYCKHGLAYFQKKLGNDILTVCGYIDDPTLITKEERQKLPNRGLKDEKILEWLRKIQKLISSLSRPESDALGPLHEINRWAAQVNTIAHRMLVKDKDLDFSGNFEAASRDMKSLYKASSMLVDAFDYLNIYYNPSSAAFGKMRSVDLYKLVDKIRIILMGAEGAAQNKKIHIIGTLRCSFDLYESFKIIPFCLLQNAIKYSFDNDITITFSSTQRDIELSVESSGPPIHDIEKTRIFEKGYRGEWSKKIHHEGLGVGLYIAKIVAEAHNLEIKVRSLPKHYQREGIPMHANIFSIKLLIGGSIERRNILKS